MEQSGKQRNGRTGRLDGHRSRREVLSGVRWGGGGVGPDSMEGGHLLQTETIWTINAADDGKIEGRPWGGPGLSGATRNHSGGPSSLPPTFWESVMAGAVSQGGARVVSGDASLIRMSHARPYAVQFRHKFVAFIFLMTSLNSGSFQTPKTFDILFKIVLFF